MKRGRVWEGQSLGEGEGLKIRSKVCGGDMEEEIGEHCKEEPPEDRD